MFELLSLVFCTKTIAKKLSTHRFADKHWAIALTLDLASNTVLNVDYNVQSGSAKAPKNPTKASLGAVRKTSPVTQAKSRLPLQKISVCGLCVVFVGLMATTTSTDSNGTVEAAPKPLKVASMLNPTFFFDDATNALGEGKQLFSKPQLDAEPLLPVDDYATQQTLLQDLQAITPDTLAGTEPTRTITVSPLVNHPTIAALRERAEAPSDAVETIVTVESGDTLSGILNDNGISVEQMPKLLSDKFVIEHLSNLRIGQKLTVVRRADGRFHSMTAKVGKDKRVTIRNADSGFAVASIDLPIEKERVVTSGTIEHSLFVAAEQAKLKQSTIMELADIFEWELDFSKDIRKGDQFSIVFDRLYREGKYIGDGDILAAEFIRGGRAYRAIRFTTDDGRTDYYSPDGRSKRRTFLRHPVDVVRITSRFDPKRMHPVLNQIRAHRGVDYGSPYGSPIYATADGVIKHAGFQSAYGNRVIIQHGNSISTLYAHMSKIGKNTKKGVRVQRGDVIGYVGKTGRVTGTHLHYEFRKDGKHMDPLKVTLPEAAPIAAQYRDSLRAVSDEMVAQMRSVIGPETAVASAMTEEVVPEQVANAVPTDFSNIDFSKQ